MWRTPRLMIEQQQDLQYVHALFLWLGCTDDIVTSDHSPVFATFEVGVTSQFVSKKGKVVNKYLRIILLHFLWYLCIFFFPSNTHHEVSLFISVLALS